MIMMDGKEAMTTFEHGNAVVFCDAFGGKLQVRFFYGDWITVTKTAESDQLDAAERKTLHDACISANMPAAMRTATLRWINDEHNNEHHEQDGRHGTIAGTATSKLGGLASRRLDGNAAQQCLIKAKEIQIKIITDN